MENNTSQQANNEHYGLYFILSIVMVFAILGLLLYATHNNSQKEDVIDSEVTTTSCPEYLEGLETIQRDEGEDLSNQAYSRFMELVNDNKFSASECSKRMLAEGYSQTECESALTNAENSDEINWKNVAYERGEIYFNKYNNITRDEFIGHLKEIGFTGNKATYAANMLRIFDSSDNQLKSSNSSSKSSEAKSATIGELNALSKALDYLRIMHFSKKGLKEQLLFEKFTESEAEYAVTHLDIDWKLQAVGKAQDYLNTMSFSKQGLKEQLEFEGFTSNEAQYGVDVAYK